MVKIKIDGKDHEVAEGEILLKALKAMGIKIPTLCYHPALKKPIGACKLCAVEVKLRDKP